MTKVEFAQFVDSIRTFYSKEKILPNQQAVELWYSQLKDIDFKVALAVLQQWTHTEKWSPSIADIRKRAADIVDGELMSYGEAWQLVLKSVWLYGSSQIEEALAYIESFNPVAAKSARNVGYFDICMSENIANERANFRRIYEAECERVERDRVLSIELKEQIKALNTNAERRLNG